MRPSVPPGAALEAKGRDSERRDEGKVFSLLKIMILILCISKLQEVCQIIQIYKVNAVTFSWFLSEFSASPRQFSFPGCTA